MPAALFVWKFWHVDKNLKIFNIVVLAQAGMYEGDQSYYVNSASTYKFVIQISLNTT